MKMRILRYLLLRVARRVVVRGPPTHGMRNCTRPQPPNFGTAQLESEIFHEIKVPVCDMTGPGNEHLDLPPEYNDRALKISGTTSTSNMKRQSNTHRHSPSGPLRADPKLMPTSCAIGVTYFWMNSGEAEK